MCVFVYKPHKTVEIPSLNKEEREGKKEGEREKGREGGVEKRGREGGDRLREKERKN